MPGGELMKSANTVGKCKNECEKTLINCYGVDFHDQLKQCWLHNNMSAPVAAAASGFTHYEYLHRHARMSI